MRSSPLTPISPSPLRRCSISFALLAASLAALKPYGSSILIDPFMNLDSVISILITIFTGFGADGF